MKLKVRGYDAEFLNTCLQWREYDLLVGYDESGKEVYTGDTVIDPENGGEYKVELSLDLHYLPFDSCISNYKLKE